MTVYIIEHRVTKSLYLYKANSDIECTEEFIGLFSDSEFIPLTEIERMEYDTNALHMTTADNYARWYKRIENQQKIFDSYDDLGQPMPEIKGQLLMA